MTFFTPVTDGELGEAEAINLRLRQMQAAITARRGVMVEAVGWTTLVADAPYISIDVPQGYSQLCLMAGLRSNYAGALGDHVKLAINDEFLSDYKTHGWVNGSDNTYPAADSWTIPIGAASASALAGVYGAMTVNIAAASAPIAKLAHSYTSTFYIAGQDVNLSTASHWCVVTAAISRLRLSPNAGTALLAGSYYALYGMN